MRPFFRRTRDRPAPGTSVAGASTPSPRPGATSRSSRGSRGAHGARGALVGAGPASRVQTASPSCGVWYGPRLVRSPALSRQAGEDVRHGGASAKPIRPSRLKRWIQARTRRAESPSRGAMSGAVSPWALAQMIWARCPKRWGAVREPASRFSSSTSSAVNARTFRAVTTLPDKSGSFSGQQT